MADQDFERDRYLAFMGRAPRRIPHWEHWSDPDAETWLTGIDPLIPAGDSVAQPHRPG